MTPVAKRGSGRNPVPQLVDEDVVDLEDDDDADVDPPVGNDHPVGLPSILTENMLQGIARICCFPSQLTMRVPRDDERPWNLPPGWMYLYDAFFTHSHLWFPLLCLLTSYAVARDIAFDSVYSCCYAEHGRCFGNGC